MDLRLILLLASLAAACLASSSLAAPADEPAGLALDLNAPPQADQAPPAAHLSARKRFKLPKLFDFGQFKRLFKRTYASFLEGLARQRLYLARAFRVFISAVGYKHQKQSFYLGINELSDRTPEEIDRTHLHFDGSESLHHLEAHVADEETIMQELAHLRDSADPELAAELSQLEDDGHLSRRRRSSPTSRRELSIDELALPDEAAGEEEPNPKLVRVEPSNNPDYVPPEITSFGHKRHDDSVVDRLDDTTTDDLNSRVSKLNYVDLLNRRGLDRGHLPDKVEIDHRDTKCLFAPRSQRDCGSCYIFPVIALYEYLYCRETGHLVAFSEQYPLECGLRIGMQACNGGTADIVFEFSRLYGLALRRDYAYSGEQQLCPYEMETPARQMGYMRADNIKYRMVRTHQFDEVLKVMPIVAYLAVQDRFHEYGGGVDDGKGCMPHRGHAVMIVGSGREDGVDYWLMRNSYGVKYGEAGHYKIDKRANCTSFIQPGFGFVVTGKFEPKHSQNKNQRHQLQPYLARQLADFKQTSKAA